MKTAQEGRLLVCSVYTIFLLGHISGLPCGREETGKGEQEGQEKEPTLLHTYYVLHRYYYPLLPT